MFIYSVNVDIYITVNDNKQLYIEEFLDKYLNVLNIRMLSRQTI